MGYGANLMKASLAWCGPWRPELSPVAALAIPALERLLELERLLALEPALQIGRAHV